MEGGNGQQVHQGGKWWDWRDGDRRAKRDRYCGSGRLAGKKKERVG